MIARGLLIASLSKQLRTGFQRVHNTEPSTGRVSLLNNKIEAKAPDRRLMGLSGIRTLLPQWPDSLEGEAGNDALQSEAGNDRLFCGAGQDVLMRGSGQDVFVFETTYSCRGRSLQVLGPRRRWLMVPKQPRLRRRSFTKARWASFTTMPMVQAQEHK